ncbi:murein L,D-transpeptidase catalytic domain family protein [Flavobacterium sp. AC]|uniref:Murein L,D-transpeptidase catalytic domain family protein n=1 Tax=Flavobacterium azizsancarii TaxID=2961580 RepID=A0ABT4W8J1_9FLAO|nr:murein L,D-transpeptidase catalytic domain family protein [Flavobacterium azizsancarii]MDA6068868.1 murein L,D-transpeptidase catalytic domain family protein [Flavobacterium azizsancarii]
MKKIFFIFLLMLSLFIGYVIVFKKKDFSLLNTKSIDIAQIDAVKKIVNSSAKYNKNFAFFIDMKVHSGKFRFFVYDLKNNKIIDRGIVAHGSGSETGIKGKLKFSNIPNSLSTSLGTYSIGNQYYGKFGKSYRLHGLDATNSNAFSRDIVFHYYFDVPYKEQDNYICNSYGCPMVNKKYFNRIAQIIDNSKSHIVMSIYY